MSTEFLLRRNIPESHKEAFWFQILKVSDYTSLTIIFLLKCLWWLPTVYGIQL